MGCLAGRAQMPPETGWEPFSAAEDPAEDYCASEWADIVLCAKKNGVKVNFTRKGIEMIYGRAEGLFKDYRGGVKLAQQFLKSLGFEQKEENHG